MELIFIIIQCAVLIYISVLTTMAYVLIKIPKDTHPKVYIPKQNKTPMLDPIILTEKRDEDILAAEADN